MWCNAMFISPMLHYDRSISNPFTSPAEEWITERGTGVVPDEALEEFRRLPSEFLLPLGDVGAVLRRRNEDMGKTSRTILSTSLTPLSVPLTSSAVSFLFVGRVASFPRSISSFLFFSRILRISNCNPWSISNTSLKWGRLFGLPSQHCEIKSANSSGQ